MAVHIRDLATRLAALASDCGLAGLRTTLDEVAREAAELEQKLSVENAEPSQ